MKARGFFSILVPFVTWLLLGAPSLTSSACAIIFVVLTVFEWNLIWRHAIFSAFRGNPGIYGTAASAINSLCTIVAIAFGIAVYYVDRTRFADGAHVRVWVYGVWIICLVATWIVPMLSSTPERSLPSAASNRPLEDPKK